MWKAGTGIIPDKDEKGNLILRYFSVIRNTEPSEPWKVVNTVTREIVREIYYDGTFETIDKRWGEELFRYCRRQTDDYCYSWYTHRMLGMHVNPSNENVRVYSRNINKYFDPEITKYIDVNTLFKNFEGHKWYSVHEFVLEMNNSKFKLFYEYMSKVGLTNLAMDFLAHDGWLGCKVDVKKTSLIDILGLNKEKYKQLLALGKDAKASDLYRFQKEIQWDLKTDEEWKIYKKHIDSKYEGTIKSFFKIYPSTLHKFGKYAGKEIDLGGYVDYLETCKKIGLDLKNTFVLFPNNLKEANKMVQDMWKEMQFDLTLKEYADEANKYSKKYSNTVVSIYSKKYAFEDDKYIIKVPATTKEIGEEGFKLRHCVAKYMDDICAKNKVILFIREKKDINSPFFTLEVMGNEVTQCKGYRNCPRPDDVQAFLESFAKDKGLSITKDEYFQAVM